MNIKKSVFGALLTTGIAAAALALPASAQAMPVEGGGVVQTQACEVVVLQAPSDECALNSY